MKKFLSILALVLAGLALTTCDIFQVGERNDDDLNKMITGSKYYVQSYYLSEVGSSDWDVYYIILENGWADGQIQTCYLRGGLNKLANNLYSEPGTITFKSGKATISGLNNTPACQSYLLDGTWDFEYDDEYYAYILRKGSQYIVFQ